MALRTTVEGACRCCRGSGSGDAFATLVRDSTERRHRSSPCRKQGASIRAVRCSLAAWHPFLYIRIKNQNVENRQATLQASSRRLARSRIIQRSVDVDVIYLAPQIVSPPSDATDQLDTKATFSRTFARNLRTRERPN